MLRTSSWLLLAGLISCIQACAQQSGSADKMESPASLADDGSEPTFQDQFEMVKAGKSIALRLTQVKISHEQFRRLNELHDSLLELQLDAGIVDDSTVSELASLTALEHLRLRESPITDAGILKLQPEKLPNLRILNLPQSSLTATGLEHLKAFPKLVQLRLGGGQLDDRAAEVLAKFMSLRSLHLIGPNFTDAALEHLAAAPKLSSLYIDDCHLSDAAWEKLFAAKPNLHVHIDQHHHDRDPHASH